MRIFGAKQKSPIENIEQPEPKPEPLKTKTMQDFGNRGDPVWTLRRTLDACEKSSGDYYEGGVNLSWVPNSLAIKQLTLEDSIEKKKGLTLKSTYILIPNYQIQKLKDGRVAFETDSCEEIHQFISEMVIHDVATRLLTVEEQASEIFKSKHQNTILAEVKANKYCTCEKPCSASELRTYTLNKLLLTSIIVSETSIAKITYPCQHTTLDDLLKNQSIDPAIEIVFP